MLIANGADVNAMHGNGGTALMFAVMFGRNDIIETLIDNDADVNLKDKRGLDVLDIAFQQGNKAALDALQKIKAA
ncbi:ankyrin repeat domain-containing protein [Flavobacterium psychrotrophum]|uniref:ankyrin repeat domain-containing protein n=1 Tax=Flavobacterium psychrotrophum TaxID=2294119 RepID=UPI00196998AB|nr:ankyrin repeat domain-containing protein [Flavobacterium psychrotrophum]